METHEGFIHWFRDIGIADVPSVGGKNASLGEMYRELGSRGVRVPNGFATTAAAFRATLEQGDAAVRLHRVLDGVHPADVVDLAHRAAAARDIVRAMPLPAALEQGIRMAWRTLRGQYDHRLTVAVRSSATAEDLPTASFAGQHDTYLNIDGEAALLDSIHRCFASLFTDRAIVYRIENGFDHFSVYLSVGIMKMVRADLASSGVIFTLDTETGFRDVILVTGAYGLGENVVQGTVDPDEFYVFKPTLREARRAVLRRSLGGKEVRMVYASSGGGVGTRNETVEPEERERFCLDDAGVLELAEAAATIEQHYSARAGHPVPMDIEWARDGLDGQLYIVQARPETVASRQSGTMLDEYSLEGKGRSLVSGRAVGSKVISGRARVVAAIGQLGELQPGEVLVAETTMPDWGTVMKIAAGVVTNRGGRTCHAAIVAREIGVPALVGCGNATEVIRTGDAVTVSCAEGAIGHVYAGLVPFRKTSTDLSALPMPRTRLMINIGNPDAAFRLRLLPNDGVGLARMEFIVAEHIRIHPMALVHPERVEDASACAEIARLTRQYPTPADYFVRELSEGVGTIAAAFIRNP